MAQTVPENGLSLSVAAVRTVIAACPAWHEWTRVINKPEEERLAAAAKRVHLFALPGPERPQDGYTADELDAMRPVCGLTLRPPAMLRGSQAGYRRTRTAAETFIENATVYVHVVETVESAIKEDEALVMLRFCNRLGGLIDDMLETYNVDDAAYIQAIELAIEPVRATEVHQGTQGDFVQAMLRVDTGLDE